MSKVINYICAFLVLGLVCSSNETFAQKDEGLGYSSEFIWGLNKNTSSGLLGGFILKKSIAISDRTFKTFGLEIINVKHLREHRYSSRRTGNFFIWGKRNYLYTFRTQYGRDFIIFRKAPQQGVQVAVMFAGGPSIGLLAPYYIEFSQSQSNESQSEQYDPNNVNHHFQNILGTGSLFQGLGKSKIKIGANIKVGLNFEFGTFKSNVTGFEIGFLIDAYTDKINLIPKAENKAVIPTAFISLFYGSRR